MKLPELQRLLDIIDITNAPVDLLNCEAVSVDDNTIGGIDVSGASNDVTAEVESWAHRMEQSYPSCSYIITIK